MYTVTTDMTVGGLSASQSFTITIWSDCVSSVISATNSPAVAAMETEVGGTASTQTLAFTNSIAESHSDPNYCGPFTYTLDPVMASLSITGDVVTLSTNDPAQTGGPTSETLTVQLENYTTTAGAAITYVTAFDVTVTCVTQSNDFDTTTPTAIEFNAGKDE